MKFKWESLNKENLIQLKNITSIKFIILTY